MEPCNRKRSPEDWDHRWTPEEGHDNRGSDHLSAGASTIASSPGVRHAAPISHNHTNWNHDQKLLLRTFSRNRELSHCVSRAAHSRAPHDVVVSSMNEVRRYSKLAACFETSNSLTSKVTVSSHHSTGTRIHTYYGQLDLVHFYRSSKLSAS